MLLEGSGILRMWDLLVGSHITGACPEGDTGILVFFPFSLFPGFHEVSSVCPVMLSLASPLAPNQGINRPWTETSETVRQNITFLFIVVYLGHFVSIRKQHSQRSLEM